MANTITKTTIEEGTRNLVVVVNILGDASGDETATVLIDRSTYTVTTDLEMTIDRVFGLLTGFSARLLVDGTTDIVVCQMPDGQPFDYDWKAYGGFSSNKVASGKTGDILITTSGLGSAEQGTFTLVMRKGQ